MDKRWIQLFIKSAGALLLAAALERFLVAAGNVQIVSLGDPLTGIPFRYVILMVGILELVVAVVCLFGKRPFLQGVLIMWLSVDYGIWWIGMKGHPQASAAGSFTDPLHLSGGLTGFAISAIPIYLFVGSCALLAALRAGDRVALQSIQEAAFSKMFCPSCGTGIKFAVENLGQKIDCPRCKAKITLRKPEEMLKMTCFFCKEHIEFPAHALGQKIKCPHCAMNVGLNEELG